MNQNESIMDQIPTSLRLKKGTLKKIARYKVHPRQSYDEAIERLIDLANGKVGTPRKVLNKESVSDVEEKGSFPSYPTGIVLGCSSDIDVGSPVIWNRSPDWGAEWLLKHYDQIT